jgi:predicted metal-binding protein
MIQKEFIHTLFVCTLCRSSEVNQQAGSGGQYLFDRLQEELATSGCNALRLHPVRCMGSCSRSCMTAFAAPNKLTFILSDLSPVRSVPELVQFSQQYIAYASGHVPYKERPALIRSNLLVVLPPSPPNPGSLS